MFVDEVSNESAFLVAHCSLVDVAPIAFVQLQRFGVGEFSVGAKLPCDRLQLWVVPDADCRRWRWACGVERRLRARLGLVECEL